MKKLFAMLLTFGLIAAIGMGTTGCGKKDEKPKGTTPPAAEKKPEEKPKAP